MAEDRRPVMITCPTTDQEIPTGSWVTEAEWEADKSVATVALTCPACSEEHSWDRDNAFLGQP